MAAIVTAATIGPRSRGIDACERTRQDGHPGEVPSLPGTAAARCRGHACFSQASNQAA